jgi:hypothetical protein
VWVRPSSRSSAIPARNSGVAVWSAWFRKLAFSQAGRSGVRSRAAHAPDPARIRRIVAAPLTCGNGALSQATVWPKAAGLTRIRAARAGGAISSRAGLADRPFGSHPGYGACPAAAQHEGGYGADRRPMGGGGDDQACPGSRRCAAREAPPAGPPRAEIAGGQRPAVAGPPSAVTPCSASSRSADARNQSNTGSSGTLSPAATCTFLRARLSCQPAGTGASEGVSAVRGRWSSRAVVSSPASRPVLDEWRSTGPGRRPPRPVSAFAALPCRPARRVSGP